MPGPYDRNDVIRCSVNFKNLAGTDFDPAAVIFKLRTPAGVESSKTYGTDIELVKDSTGNYHIDFEVLEGGTYYFRFKGTGAGAGEDSFVVNHSQFTDP